MNNVTNEVTNRNVLGDWLCFERREDASNRSQNRNFPTNEKRGLTCVNHDRRGVVGKHEVFKIELVKINSKNGILFEQ